MADITTVKNGGIKVHEGARAPFPFPSAGYFEFSVLRDGRTFRAEKRSAQASAHPLSQAQAGLLTVFDCLFVCH